MRIGRKAMIRNRFNYLTHSVQETEGKDVLKATAPQLNTSSKKPKGQFLNPHPRPTKKKIKKMAKQLSKIKIKYQDTHAKTQQKHRLGMVSNLFYWEGELKSSSAVVYAIH